MCLSVVVLPLLKVSRRDNKEQQALKHLKSRLIKQREVLVVRKATVSLPPIVAPDVSRRFQSLGLERISRLRTTYVATNRQLTQIHESRGTNLRSLAMPIYRRQIKSMQCKTTPPLLVTSSLLVSISDFGRVGAIPSSCNVRLRARKSYDPTPLQRLCLPAGFT